ncbi:hypothetical protein CHS0354_033523, partial [Potamilus streckersoni]
NGSFKIAISSADLNKSSNNPLNSSADADRTEKNNYAQDDNIKLTEEARIEDNPAKGELEVGKFLDTSKVVRLLLCSENSLKKIQQGEGGLTIRLAVVDRIQWRISWSLLPHPPPPRKLKDLVLEYLRTADFAKSEIKDMLQTDKPQIIYEKLNKKYDEVTRPTGMQKIPDKKKYENSKGHTTGHKKTVANHIQQLENIITRSHPFV